MMSVRAVFLLVAFYVASAEDFDLKDAQSFVLGYQTLGKWRGHEHLEVYAVLDTNDLLDHLTEIKLFWSEQGAEDKQLLALVNSTGLFEFAKQGEFDNNSELDSPSDSVAVISVDWRDKGIGYCRGYTAKFTGVDANGVTRSATTATLEVGPPEGSTCEVKPKVEIPEYIQDAFPGATQGQLENALDKINAIDDNTYDVSGIYQGRVYLASMKDTHFELHKMNELCKTSGGYLVELDDTEEEWFVRDFLKSLGSYQYFTGANDVDDEGNFVYYNSGKPVTNVVWSKNEPNNFGNEDCVEIKYTGFNDRRCSRDWGYICEVPLL